MSGQEYAQLCALIVKLYKRIKNQSFACRCIGVTLSQISPAQAMWEPHITIRSNGSVSWFDGGSFAVSDFTS